MNRTTKDKTSNISLTHYTYMAGVEGLEPPTPGFGDRCSSHLSYTPIGRIIPLITPAYHWKNKIPPL
jgi:hypothetical protein